MKTIFDLLDDISYNKPDYKLEASDDFNKFMICRWLSMVSPQYSYIINEIYNVKHKAFTSDQMLFDTLKVLLPKVRIGRIQFLKKGAAANKKSKNEDIVSILADSWELSKNEVKQIIETVPEIAEFYKEEDLKSYTKRSK